MHPSLVSLWRATTSNLNFFRIHLIVFTVTPLIFSGIMYASNGEYPISYIDCLFNCVSAMTVTGLATVNLSGITAWQQTIIFILMSCGNIVTVSWVMVLVRKSFFLSKFEHIVRSRITAKADDAEAVPSRLTTKRRAVFGTFGRWFKPGSASQTATDGKIHNLSSGQDGSLSGLSTPKKTDTDKGGRVRPDMIRRVHEDKPRLVNPMGWISEKVAGIVDDVATEGQEKTASQDYQHQKASVNGPDASDGSKPGESSNSDDALSERSVRVVVESPKSIHSQLPDSDNPVRHDPLFERKLPTYMATEQVEREDQNDGAQPPFTRPSAIPQHFQPHLAPTAIGLPRTQTIEFVPNTQIPRRRGKSISSNHRRDSVFSNHNITSNDASLSPPEGLEPTFGASGEGLRERRRRGSITNAGPSFGAGRTMSRTMTMHTTHSHFTAATHPLQHTPTGRNRDVGFGGFPGPHEILARIIRKLLPNFSRRLTRTISMPARTTTLASQGGQGTIRTGLGMTDARTKSVPYISFDATVGRNSHFHDLSEEELEELGGIEYRALQALLWLVPIYHFGTQLFVFTIIAPYLSISKWHDVFTSQIRQLSSTWYSAFVVVSAYTNNGMSLVDTSLIPFQYAYLQTVFLFFIILAGNTAYPVFFRFMIWVITKFVPTTSRAHETLHFLLDHPRRCFVYLFPSHQTWFLLTFITLLTLTDWVSFLVLDIGNPEIEKLPVGLRMLDGLLQSAAVRAAGFGIVTLGSLAPAVKVLYVIMMYVSVYPIALSVRSTNVYEERSLGLDDEGLAETDAEPTGEGPRAKVWGSYLAWHARKQLAFDMWWLGLALVLVCIIERGQILDKQKDAIDIFPILFELVSAYGTVGLSLGLSDQNYSLAGAFSPLSKLIVCLVMIRGRHRGLPVAIDRAVMLPDEFKQNAENQDPNEDNAGDDDDESSQSSNERRPSITRRPSAQSRRRSLSASRGRSASTGPTGDPWRDGPDNRSAEMDERSPMRKITSGASMPALLSPVPEGSVGNDDRFGRKKGQGGYFHTSRDFANGREKET